MHWKICCQMLIEDTLKGTKISEVVKRVSIAH